MSLFSFLRILTVVYNTHHYWFLHFVQHLVLLTEQEPSQKTSSLLMGPEQVK